MARFEVVEGRFVVLVGPEDETLLVTGLLAGQDECARAIVAIRLFATMVDRYDRREARHSGPYFVLKGGDDSVLATSCACHGVEARERAIELVRTTAPDAEVLQVSSGPQAHDDPLRWATRDASTSRDAEPERTDRGAEEGIGRSTSGSGTGSGTG